MYSNVFLVHGYNKTRADMGPLKRNLEALNYRVLCANLPLTFKPLAANILIFRQQLQQAIKELDGEDKISLVGHSSGGLIIRSYLASLHNLNHLHRAVLIATPNAGSSLAELAVQTFPPIVKVVKMLGSLQPSRVNEMKLPKKHGIEVGAIAGNKDNLWLGRLLKGKNDGRVRVSSVEYEGLDDLIILPYGHKEIHHQIEVASLVDSFLQHGFFKQLD